MANKSDKKRVFSFVEDSPVVKQTEQKVIKEYERLENDGISNADSTPSRIANAPEQPLVQHDIPAAVAMAQPGEPMQNINVPIPISLHSRLKIMAAQQRINMKDLVALAIKEYVEKQEA